jgi:hypothetical protein
LLVKEKDQLEETIVYTHRDFALDSGKFGQKKIERQNGKSKFRIDDSKNMKNQEFQDLLE